MGFRTGAVPSRDMMVVLEESATKSNANGVGLDLETVLSVKVWVRTLGDTQYSWVDLHVFDQRNELIHSETLPLRYVGPAEDGGHVLQLESGVHRGTGASPGSVWLAPDARKVQYRLYVEVAGTVFSDGLLRQHELPPDSVVGQSGPPARGTRPATAYAR